MHINRRTFLVTGTSTLLLSVPVATLLMRPSLTFAASWPTYRKGNTGENVRSIQYFLRYRGHDIDADSDFGPQTEAAVKSFQRSNGLDNDGIVGPLTWPKLIVQTRKGNSGNAVTALQRQLNRHINDDIVVDGDFGPNTEAAVKSFQRSNGLDVDGIAGPNTWSELVGGSAGGGSTPPPSGTALRDINSFPRTIEGYASYDPQSTCSASAKPGVVAFKNMFLSAFPSTSNSGITRSCSTSGTSEHEEGRAWDWGANVNNATQKAAVDKALAWLFATDEYGHKHAMIRRTGVMYIIWNRRIWSAYKADEGWRSYSGDSPHTDHVHFSFSWAGARKETSFWTS